jgi:hypothetical protein
VFLVRIIALASFFPAFSFLYEVLRIKTFNDGFTCTDRLNQDGGVYVAMVTTEDLDWRPFMILISGAVFTVDFLLLISSLLKLGFLSLSKISPSPPKSEENWSLSSAL